MTQSEQSTGPVEKQDGGEEKKTGGASKERRKRSLKRKLVYLGLGLLVFSASGIGGAEYYTSQPDFCGTCHIMDPYYESWAHDLHGKKVDVRCVDCHYAPGQQHTLMAKFRGLSQLASYFSGRSGASRPRAHVNSASCLTSRCHGDEAHINKQILIGEPRTETRMIAGTATTIERKPTVRFVHAKHLHSEEHRAETEKLFEAAASRLKNSIGPEAFERVAAAARSIRPVAQREEDMRGLLVSLGHESAQADALELMRLEDLNLRHAQLADLNCAACHTYDAGGAKHFQVDRTTCFTCHFTNQAFNRDTGECLKCHEPPSRKIAIHSTTVMASSTAGSALMDHQDIVDRKIDCTSCHFDVVQGEAAVSARDCGHCHDQGRYTKDFETRDTKVVEEYHRVHVSNQHARCVDCHRAIQHRLIRPEEVGSSEEFIKPVMNDCVHCHPKHHHEQAQLLMGVGGRGVEQAMPNAMFGSRVNCRACHTQMTVDAKGDELIKATQTTCVACHGEDYRRLFDQWMSEIDSSLKEAEGMLAHVDEGVAALKAAGGAIPAELTGRIEAARANIEFVRSGNGIHNKNYSLQLLDIAIRTMEEAIAVYSQGS